MRARASGGVDPFDGSTEEIWKNRLAQIFASLATLHPDYLQLRYIGRSGNGREIVRVDGKAGVARQLPDAQLQSKAAIDYFHKAVNQPAHTIFLSDITLNREYGEIEKPSVPVIRVATPVFTETGKSFGIVIINII
jgi:hypothetical protein